MFESRLRKYLKESERLIRIVRPYWLTMLGSMALSAILSIAPFFFLVPLFRLGGWGVGGFIVLVVGGVYLIARTAFVFSLNAFIVTKSRIIDVDQRGFFDRTVSESSFDTIQDISVRIRGIFQTMFHYGSVVIQTAGTTANIELHGVKDPEEVQEMLTRLVQDRRNTETDESQMSATELLHLAEKIKEGLTPDQFRRMTGEKEKGNRITT